MSWNRSYTTENRRDGQNINLPKIQVSWYRKNLIPSIPSLEKVCNAFGITLSQFFSEQDDDFTLTPSQKELLKEAGHLTCEQQTALIAFFKTL